MTTMSGIAEARKFGAIPIYERIQKDLRASVRSGEWRAGVMLPSRKALARTYGVDVNTIQRAIAPLLNDATLRADGGRGTFVSACGNHPTQRDFRPETDKRWDLGNIGRSRMITVGIIWKTDKATDGKASPNFWAPVVGGIERAVSRAHGMSRNLDLGRPNNAKMTLEEAAGSLVDQGVDGIISVVDRSPQEMEELLDSTSSIPVPIVHAGGTLTRNYGLNVYFSNVDAGYHAAAHLIDRGCREVLFFAGYTTAWVQQRAQGVHEAFSAAGLSRDNLQRSIAQIDLYPLLAGGRLDMVQMQLGYEAASNLLRKGLPATGIVAANDYNAHSFMKAAKKAGYRSGVDYAIIGFDDFPESRTLGLTTVHPPLDAMGREAVAMLFRAIDDPRLTLRTCLPSDLIARESTMAFA